MIARHFYSSNRAWSARARLSAKALLLGFLLSFIAGCSTLPSGPRSESGLGQAGTPPAPMASPVPSGPLTRIDAPLEQLVVAESASPATALDLTAPAPDVWERIRRGFAIPNLETELANEWTRFYTERPRWVVVSAERASKYLFHIVEEIERRGLPTELALLPFVESAFNPHAQSPARAVGLWQFIPSTGRHFELQQNRWRDDRRDPVASTRAALDYLEYLFDFHGDWYLALASYNWGQGAVRRSMDRNEAAGLPTDYLSIRMPDETRNYVPKLQAIKNIISDPQRFGIELPMVENEPYFVIVPKTRSIDVRLAAELANMPLEDFRDLNAAHLRQQIRGGQDTRLLLPADRADQFLSNLEAFSGSLAASSEYEVVRGDTLGRIARRNGVSLQDLMEANNLNARSILRPGQVLQIPGGAAPVVRPVAVASNSAAAAAQVAAASRQGGSTQAQPSASTQQSGVRTHRVRAGDTLYSLARRYNSTVAALQRANNLRGSALRVGQQLRIP